MMTVMHMRVGAWNIITFSTGIFLLQGGNSFSFIYST